jgi:hypothetical protein
MKDGAKPTCSKPFSVEMWRTVYPFGDPDRINFYSNAAQAIAKADKINKGSDANFKHAILNGLKDQTPEPNSRE